MVGFDPNLTKRTATLALALGLFFALPKFSNAQGFTPDPYNLVGEYNGQYEPFMYATQPNGNSMVPNQYRYESNSGLRAANQFQKPLAGRFDSDDTDGDDVTFRRSSAPRLRGLGQPYYSAHRSYDAEFKRTYRPNEMADQSFNEEQKLRNEKYFEAIRQTDKRKRAQLLREYNMENLRSSRSLSVGRNASPAERKRALDRDRFDPDDEKLLGPDEERGDMTGSDRSAPPKPATNASSASENRAPAAGSAVRPGAPARTGSTSTPSLFSNRSSSLPPVRQPVRPAPRSSSTGTSATSGAASERDRTTSIPFGGGFGTGPSSLSTPPLGSRPSDILERSELLDRATRATSRSLPRLPARPAAPSAPSSTAP